MSKDQWATVTEYEMRPDQGAPGRTQWNVTKDFYMGLDVMYSKLQSATAFNGTAVGTGTLLVPLAPSPKADMCGATRNVRLVPEADIP